MTRWLGVFGLALLYTLFNAAKPLVVDDAAYFYFADQLAKDALDPYGFEVFWYERPEPANHVLAPPVLHYWWSLAIRLFGTQPVLWKLWLFPFSLLFTWALFELARRFARGLEWPLVTLTVLSPAFLPSLNLMLDVPALALSLAAVVLFLHAAERHSWWLAILSGLLAGLAMQTKYTSFVTPAVILAAAWQGRRLRWGFAAAVTAVLVFAAWETFIAIKYGESHFLHASRESQAVMRASQEAFLAQHPTDSALLRRGYALFFTLTHKSILIWPLLSVFGAVASGLLLFQLAALGVSRRRFAWAALLLVLGFVLIAVVPTRFQSVLNDPVSGMWINLDGLFYGASGVVLYGLTAKTSRRLRRRAVVAESRECRRLLPGKRKAVFLTLCLVLEILGYFALTPFPAVRRVLGLVVIVTLLAGQLAARTCRRPERRRLVHVATGFSVVLGLLFWGVDLLGAAAHKDGARLAAFFTKEQPPDATVWFVGHWGFQFYAEQAGMRPVVPNESRLRPGDWLVVPDPSHVHQQRITLDPERTELANEMTFSVGASLTTMPGYYGGLIPLERKEGPRIVVRRYRITAEHVARWKPSAP